MADRLCARGYPVYRFDMPGLGDTDGDLPEYHETYWRYVEAGGQTPWSLRSAGRSQATVCHLSLCARRIVRRGDHQHLCRRTATIRCGRPATDGAGRSRYSRNPNRDDAGQHSRYAATRDLGQGFWHIAVGWSTAPGSGSAAPPASILCVEPAGWRNRSSGHFMAGLSRP